MIYLLLNIPLKAVWGFILGTGSHNFLGCKLIFLLLLRDVVSLLTAIKYVSYFLSCIINASN